MDSVSTSMNVTVRDHRQLPLEELEDQLRSDLSQNPSGAVLWTACRPRKRWYLGLTNHRPLVLASSQRFEQILWLSPEEKTELPGEWELDCQFLLSEYAKLYDGGDLEVYSARVRDHIDAQEERLFPELVGFLPETERALKELSYEHRGLEAGLLRMPSILERYNLGELPPNQRERFDLDFYHLLEHNLERKLEAVFPALVYFRHQEIESKG